MIIIHVILISLRVKSKIAALQDNLDYTIVVCLYLHCRSQVGINKVLAPQQPQDYVLASGPDDIFGLHGYI